MNLLDRYTNAVKTYLPKAIREDVGSELKSSLEEELDSFQETKGDTLTESELSEWIQSKGHPAVVAAGYQERTVLIDEASFPLFKEVLKYFLIGMAILYGIRAVLDILVTADYTLTRIPLQFAYSYMHTALAGMGVITLLFHFNQEHFRATKWFSSWNPQNLPSLEQKWRHVPYVNSIASFIFTLLFLTWINSTLPVVDVLFKELKTVLAPITFSGELKPFQLPITLLLLGSLVVSASHWITPYWCRWNLLLNALIGLLTVVVLWKLSGLTFVLELSSIQQSDLTPVQLEQLVGIINRSIHIGIIIAAIINTYECGRDLFRTVQLQKQS